jgi:hypothetical protein
MFSSNDDVPSVDNPKPPRKTLLDSLREDLGFGRRTPKPVADVPPAASRRWFDIVLIWTAFAIVVGALGLGWHIKHNRVEGNAIDTRPCALAIKDYQLTGKRTYSYHFYELFGWRFIDTRTIHEETVLDVKGEPMTIIGQNPDDWWSVKVGDGEFGVQRVKNADTYSIVVGDNRDVAVVPYHALCK